MQPCRYQDAERLGYTRMRPERRYRPSVSNLYFDRFPTLIKHSIKRGPYPMSSGRMPTKPTCRYNFGQLYALRNASAASNGCTITKTVLGTLSSLGILRYRGTRAGRLRRRQISILSRCGGERVRRRRPVHHGNVSDVNTHIELKCRPNQNLRNKEQRYGAKGNMPGLYIINARSIAKPYALDQLRAELIGYGLDIAIVTETNLKKRHGVAACYIDGYHSYRRDRLARRMGGVAIFVNDRYPSEVIETPNDVRCLELLWIKTEVDNRTVYIGALYHPPTPIYETDVLLDTLEASIEMLAQNTESVIILGSDFNGLHVRESDVVQRTGLTPLIHSPTRGNNTLDRLFVSENCYSSSSSSSSLSFLLQPFKITI